MRIIVPDEINSSPQRSFLIFGSAKAGKSWTSMSIAELGKTYYIAAEPDGWADVYSVLPKKTKDNLTIAVPETLQDIKMIGEAVKDPSIKAIVVDSFTALMGLIESEIKKMGGKAVVAGLTNKLSLNSYGDLSNLALDFVKTLKATGKHLVLVCGEDEERLETAEGAYVRKKPLMTGSKTASLLPYELRAIGYLRILNGKRELWFEASQQWIAGSNYKSLTDARVIESPDFTKIFSLFPKPPKNGSTEKNPGAKS